MFRLRLENEKLRHKENKVQGGEVARLNKIIGKAVEKQADKGKEIWRATTAHLMQIIDNKQKGHTRTIFKETVRCLCA